LKASQLNSFFLEVLGVEADLKSLTARLRVTSSDGGKSWPKLGFAGTAERARTREERGRWRRTPRVFGGFSPFFLF
jgi:hypothetical protein